MPLLRSLDDESLHLLIRLQAGAISRTQAIVSGMSARQIRGRLDNGLWAPSSVRGVYLVGRSHDGHVADLTRCWVALLYAGDGAGLCRTSAEWSWKLADALPERVAVAVPASRRVRPQRLIAVHYSTYLPQRLHPVRRPPVTTVEETVLDLVDTAARPMAVVDVLTRACQRRLTTADRLMTAAAARPKLAHRQLLLGILDAVGAERVHSPLEHLYLRDVERAHGLPRGRRNAAENIAGARFYRDVGYDDFATLVELDGRSAHPTELAWRDRRRDNLAMETGDRVTLRYGWRDVAGEPCATAAQVARVLRARGWSGRPTPCRPGCPASPLVP